MLLSWSRHHLLPYVNQLRTSLIAMTSIGAHDAKTHLARLLDEAEAGTVFVITKHGRPVARLGPPDPRAMPVDQVIRQVREARQGNSLGGDSIRDLIDEGRA